MCVCVCVHDETRPGDIHGTAWMAGLHFSKSVGGGGVRVRVQGPGHHIPVTVTSFPKPPGAPPLATYSLKGARSAAVATRPWGGLLPCSPRSPAAPARPSRAACLELRLEVGYGYGYVEYVTVTVTLNRESNVVKNTMPTVTLFPKPPGAPPRAAYSKARAPPLSRLDRGVVCCRAHLALPLRRPVRRARPDSSCGVCLYIPCM